MEKLPSILPVFRVRSTILMPYAQLPIAMSENDYLGISSEVIESNIVAIVQPRPVFVKGARNKELIKAFKTGCAGRITDVSFSNGETIVNVLGLCRFDTIEEFSADANGIERVSVTYDRYLVDMESENSDFEFDKDRLMSALDLYFKHLEISTNWKEIEKTPASVLISALTMACPFHPSEKQSLLETVDIKERSDMITRIIEMNSFDIYNTANTVN